MEVFQMHLNLNQRLQEVASFKRDKFFPEEYDLALNKAMFRLLEGAVYSRFQDTQINLSHVSALIQKNKTHDVIVPSVTDPLYEEPILKGYTILPPDFIWLINARGEVLTDPVNCDQAPDLATTTYLEYVTVVPFPTVSAAPFYSNTSVSSATLGSLYTNPTEIAAGFQTIESKYVVIDNIMETMYRKYTTTPNIRVYWERYRDQFYKNSLIFVSSVNTGVITITSSAVVSQGTPVVNNYTIYNRAQIASLENKTVTLSDARIESQENIYKTIGRNNFYKSRPSEIVLDQTQDFFVIHRDEGFIVTRLHYDYIRKPRTISLNLGQNCELADSTHHKIIDLAVEILRLDTKDQTYPQTIQDTQIRTV